jgi:hypothetical protein
MPKKIQATTFVSDSARTLAQLRIACEQAQLPTTGSEIELRIRLMQYLDAFTDQDEIVCLNPNIPVGEAKEQHQFDD